MKEQKKEIEKDSKFIYLYIAVSIIVITPVVFLIVFDVIDISYIKNIYEKEFAKYLVPIFYFIVLINILVIFYNKIKKVKKEIDNNLKSNDVSKSNTSIIKVIYSMIIKKFDDWETKDYFKK